MNIFVIWHDYNGHRREGYPQTITKDTEKSEPFDAAFNYAGDCLKEAIDNMILEEIKKAAE